MSDIDTVIRNAILTAGQLQVISDSEGSDYLPSPVAAAAIRDAQTTIRDLIAEVERLRDDIKRAMDALGERPYTDGSREAHAYAILAGDA